LVTSVWGSEAEEADLESGEAGLAGAVGLVADAELWEVAEGAEIVAVGGAMGVSSGRMRAHDIGAAR